MMPPMNNPMMAMLQMARNGGNPMQMLQQMAGKTHRPPRLCGSSREKTRSSSAKLQENMAKQRGTSVEEIARQLGLPMK